MRLHTSRDTKRLGPPNPTWRDIKQLAYALLLVVPIVAVVCTGTAGLVGRRPAFWIGIGLVALTTITFTMLNAASFLVTHIDDAMQAKLHRPRV